MKNKICKFTEEESFLLISKCKMHVCHRFSHLDDDSQHDLALDAYTYLCKYHNFEKNHKPAFRTAVYHSAIDSGIIHGKSVQQKLLEKKAKTVVLNNKDNSELDQLKSARKTKLVSMDAMIEATGYDERFGITEDAETLHIKADGLRRIKRAVAGRPLAEKAVELVMDGHTMKEVAVMLGITYRRLLYNLDGTCNNMLPEKIVIEPAVEVVIEVAPVTVEAPVPVASVPVVNIPFKIYYEPVGTKNIYEQGVLDFGFIFVSKQSQKNSLYAGRR